MSDCHDDWPFKSGRRGAEEGFPVRTDEVIDELIREEIPLDNGKEYENLDEPENI